MSYTLSHDELVQILSHTLVTGLLLGESSANRTTSDKLDAGLVMVASAITQGVAPEGVLYKALIDTLRTSLNSGSYLVNEVVDPMHCEPWQLRETALWESARSDVDKIISTFPFKENRHG